VKERRLKVSKLFGLIKFIFNTLFILFASIAVVLIFAALAVLGPDTERIRIDTGSGWSLPPLSPEAQELYTILRGRVEALNTPLSNDPTAVIFPVLEGETALDIASHLQTGGLISDAELFAQLLRYNDLDTQLRAGDYQLRRNMTMREIGQALYYSRSARPIVTVPPGWRLEQLADHLTALEIMDGELFLEQARQGTIVNHPFLLDRPEGHSYEGYLFPGTYPVSNRTTPAGLISQMLDNMGRHLPQNTFSLAQQQGLTFHQVLILASIVEREAALDEERPLIASVYLNRLKPSIVNFHLQADPTVQYAMGYQSGSQQWWKTPVSLEEYQQIDSPYNTYLYPGLPPGPIASPGLASIMAVLQPAQTDYLFFVCRHPHCEGGEHVFSHTYEEHLQNARVYWEQ
jgi:UPF0755 protein